MAFEKGWIMNISVRLTTAAVVAALVCATASFSQQAAPQAAAGRGGQAQGPRVVSPEILPDKRVTFRLLAPKAGEVLLNGNWDNGTNIEMTKDDAGHLVGDRRSARRAAWGYSFSVDGVKVMDPGNGEYQRDGSPLRQPVDDLRAGVGPLGFQARRPARDDAGGLVSFRDPETEGPPHVRLHAARVRRRARRNTRCSTCCTAAAATRTRGPPWAARTSSWTT